MGTLYSQILIFILRSSRGIPESNPFPLHSSFDVSWTWMIILENQHGTKQVPVVAGPTNRGPERPARRSFESTTTTVSLPDYETSQATAKPAAISKTFFAFIGIDRSDRRFWRAVVIALVIYAIISCAVGLPFVVLVSLFIPIPPIPY
jgi:hypothetical protein